ncbi:MAG: hypothetical protein JOY98_03140 [Candidatus Eremiobacteraeota bacterium]|nr:hypothetical protein [Candidatus Eremiobacteraeota bacterium]MBV8284160.1 hypothetical protein [Candidatus Eremiobacteraeota bacterium]
MKRFAIAAFSIVVGLGGIPGPAAALEQQPDSQAATDLSSLKTLPVYVDLTDGELTVPMTLNDSMTVNAVLDSGNPGSVLFSYDLVKKHHAFDPQTLTLGPIHYQIGGWESCCMAANYALLGFDFLKHFDYVFDYPHGRMFLTPNKN